VRCMKRSQALLRKWAALLLISSGSSCAAAPASHGVVADPRLINLKEQEEHHITCRIRYPVRCGFLSERVAATQQQRCLTHVWLLCCYETRPLAEIRVIAVICWQRWQSQVRHTPLLLRHRHRSNISEPAALQSLASLPFLIFHLYVAEPNVCC
jgi:hypothetical protein